MPVEEGRVGRRRAACGPGTGRDPFRLRVAGSGGILIIQRQRTPMTQPRPAILHFALPVADLAAAQVFYDGPLGCAVGRTEPNRMDVNFFGHHLVLHVLPEEANRHLPGVIAGGDPAPCTTSAPCSRPRRSRPWSAASAMPPCASSWSHTWRASARRANS